MFDTEGKSTSSHVEKASQYKGAPVMCLIIAGVSVNIWKFPFKIAVATATVCYMYFSLDLIFKNYN